MDTTERFSPMVFVRRRISYRKGQTGSGKTHTMFGPDISDPEMRGIIPRACT